MSKDQRINLKHPIQPCGLDDRSVLRFKPNAIVEFLLKESKYDLNDLSRVGFLVEDWMQFAQLIGWSVSGYCDLSYVSNEAKDEADAAAATALGMTIDEYKGR
ncbi:hypothetical protein WMF38_57140 [Sorangium sp. So ce118]